MDELSEIDLMECVQALAGAPGAEAARIYSLWGEHALGWVGLGVAGAVLGGARRGQWLAVAGAAVLAHGGAVGLKRLVRRPRPSDPRIRVQVGTPSSLSFPSAHASSTTAAAVALAPLIGAPAGLGLAGAMALGRVTLGVHYPSDVLAGAALGLAAGACTRALARRLAERDR